MVIVLCNLKARTLANYESQGMILCAETKDRSQAQLLQPPEGCMPGDVITFEGFERKPPIVLPKKNPWDTVQPKLCVNNQSIACYEENIQFMTHKGPIACESIKGGVIH